MRAYKKVLFVGSPQYYGGNLVIAEACRVFRLLGYNAELLSMVVYPNHYVSPKWFPLKMLYLRIWKDTIDTIQNVLVACFPFLKRWRGSNTSIRATDIEGIKITKIPFYDRENTIVIYPETIYGNPLNAKYIVRWLLYFYKYENDTAAYNSSDVFVAYRMVFNSLKLNPKEYHYKINCFNSRLYRQYNFGDRTGCCYILRKGRNRADVPGIFDGPVFDDDIDQKSLVDMFNHYKYCYSYDTQTFYTSIAAVCGCIPIVVLEPGKTESDYLGQDEKHHFGVAFGDSPEQIEYAVNTREKLIKELNFTPDNIIQTRQFIELLESKFGPLSRL